MKVLHTSDWHLGARLGRHSRQPDHTAALKGLLDIVDQEAPDLILHTGDLFDATRPPYEAMDLAVRALGRMAAAAPTIVLCGNHDSGALFRVLHDLVGFATPRRLWFVSDPQVISLEVSDAAVGRVGAPVGNGAGTAPGDGPGATQHRLTVAVACMPFIPPTAIADVARGDMAAFEGTYADGVASLTGSLLDQAEQVAGSTGVVLYAAHLHVHGAVPGRSEKRISVGDDYATHTTGLHRAVYSAFGHIHDPQILPGGAATGRYAGSLIPIDFGEQEQVKQAVVVDIGTDVVVRSRPLPGGRPLTRVDGDLDTLLSRAAGGGLDHHLLRARVVSEDPVPDLVDRLLAASPECDVFDLVNVVNSRTARPIDTSAAPSEEPTLAESFAEWRATAANVGQRKAPDEAVVALLEAALGASGDQATGLGSDGVVSQVEAALGALSQVCSVRPVRLEIEGLRSFRARQVIDFTGRDYIAVIGDTGAGKSSILEALTFALYGRTTFSGQGHQELVNASSSALRVVFAFDVGGEHWEVTRALRRAGSGKVGSGVTSLRRLDDDGTPLESFEKAREVTAKVESILGLDDEAFLRTVVLPQGQFSRLLVDDDQRARASVLRQIWRTDELSEAGRLAADALAQLGPLCGRVEQVLDGEPPDADAHMAALDAEAARLAALLVDAEHLHDNATSASGVVAAAAATVTEVKRLVSRLSAWDAAAAAATALELAETHRTLGAELADVERRLTEAAAAHAAAPGDDDGYTVAEVATFTTLLHALPAMARQRRDAEAEVVGARQQVDDLTKELEAATRAEVDAQTHLRALQDGRAQVAVAARDAEAKLGTVAASLVDARRRRSECAEAQARAVATADGVGKRTQQLERSRADASQAEQLHAAAVATYEGARREAAAAHASHELHPGDPCPICERRLPDTWAPVSAPELDLARAEGKAAAQRFDEAKATVVRLEGLLMADEERAIGATKESETARDRAAEALSDLARHLEPQRAAARQEGPPPDLDRSDDDLLAPVARAADVARGALADHDARLALAQAAHSDAGRRRSGAQASHRAVAQALEAATRRSDQAGSAWADQVARLPESLRPPDPDPQPAVDRALTLLEERGAVLDGRQAERARLRAEMDALTEHQKRLGHDRRSRVEGPAGDLWDELTAHRSVVRRAAEDLGATSVDLPSAAARPVVGDLAPVVAQVAAATDQLLDMAASAAATATTSAHEARRSLAQVVLDITRRHRDRDLSHDGEVGHDSDIGHDADDEDDPHHDGLAVPGFAPEPDVVEPDVVVAAAAGLVQDAAVDLRVAQAAADSFRRRVPAIAALRSAGAVLDDRHRALADLSAALRDGAFPKWLTLRRSRSLLVHASRLLSEITAGRYAFADLDDEASQWFVFDSDNGQPRSPSSLSGGEKFVASLALALGMVEMMGRQGDRIESLFLDEGFGALDRTNLDAAVEALGSVAAGGRMVAVITHLQAVAEQIDHVLSVTREPTGTHTAWLEPSARSALADGDLDVPSGLLE